jgi:PIN domain nuclease of toxin-antitoxin system
MRLLLDTHVFVWVVTADGKLQRAAREAIVSAEEVYVSAASIWEIAIKARLGKISGDPSELAAAIEGTGFRELPVTARHAAHVATLPMHHADPFDRVLVAQAMLEPLRLLTADAVLAQYTDLVQVI